MGPVKREAFCTIQNDALQTRTTTQTTRPGRIPAHATKAGTPTRTRKPKTRSGIERMFLSREFYPSQYWQVLVYSSQLLVYNCCSSSFQAHVIRHPSHNLRLATHRPSTHPPSGPPTRPEVISVKRPGGSGTKVRVPGTRYRTTVPRGH